MRARSSDILDIVPRVGEFSTSRIVIDDRYLPFLIATFYGKTDVVAGQWHLGAQNEIVLNAAKNGHRVISISDATHAERPDPDARKFWADSTRNEPSAVRDATLARFIVVDSAVIRGAITAIGWLNPEIRNIKTFATVSAAIEEGMRYLKQDGQSPPALDPRSYRVPDAGAQSG